MAKKQVLHYTFGNHMHWVDMTWLWGEHVLPGSVRDMLHYCRETGTKGNVNFDAVGYEKLAAHAPDAFAELRQAVRKGTVEIVGASYAQPYGLFHGAESNARQRIFGVRAVERLFGIRPTTFWEEEFDFFPQLPQLLAGVGMRNASTFFQWTWHTPHMPVETESAIWWEGLDGTRLKAAPRNALNLHQWPEDFAGLLDSPGLASMHNPLILQWLELMPSKDWMCRSEVLLPAMRKLQQDKRFKIVPVTLGEFLDKAEPKTVRKYTLADTFHGMSLGKNGDRMRKLSRSIEHDLLATESLAAMIGMLGRPYPQWDVYPAWELDEAWRNLMIGQHHDNDECEGLCGHVGSRYYESSYRAAYNVRHDGLEQLAQRTGESIVFNPLPWSLKARIKLIEKFNDEVEIELPALGFSPFSAAKPVKDESRLLTTQKKIILSSKRLAVSAARENVAAIQLRPIVDTTNQSILSLQFALSIGDSKGNRHVLAQKVRAERHKWRELRADCTLPNAPKARLQIRIRLGSHGADIEIEGQNLPKLSGGMNQALWLSWNFEGDHLALTHDHPFGMSEISPVGTFTKKYPTGDWRTSTQWFEQVARPFTALSFVDVGLESGDGMLIIHDGNQAFMSDTVRPGTIHQILNMYDPWDEDRWSGELRTNLRVIPHGTLTNAQRWRFAQEFLRGPKRHIQFDQKLRPLLSNSSLDSFSALHCDNPHVGITAFYREQRHDGLDMDYPYVLRMVELDGVATTAEIAFPGKVARAHKTNLLGDKLAKGGDLHATSCPTPKGMPAQPRWSRIRVPLRPHEIATLYLDLELGRKVTRDLDAKRSVWATVHKRQG